MDNYVYQHQEVLVSVEEEVFDVGERLLIERLAFASVAALFAGNRIANSDREQLENDGLPDSSSYYIIFEQAVQVV